MHFAYAIRGRCGQLVLVPTRSEFARSGSTTSVENSLGSVLKSLPDQGMRLGPGWARSFAVRHASSVRPFRAMWPAPQDANMRRVRPGSTGGPGG